MPFENDDAGTRNSRRLEDCTIREEAWLLGQPSLADYLDRVRQLVDGGAELDRRGLIDGWRAADDHYYALETSEAGIADEAECLALPDAMIPLAERLSRHEHFRTTFDQLPTTFGMVELDKIVVSQRRVTLPFVEALRAKLDPRLDEAGLFRFCQPIERRDPPVAMRRPGGQRFVFTSDSSDLRFHDPVLLRPDQVTGHESVGPISGIVGLVVGYGSNSCRSSVPTTGWCCTTAITACALRAAGFTHAPCVIQTVTRRDELEIVAAQPVIDDSAFYYRAKRPPLLKNFFDPRIRTVLRTKRMERIIEVSFEIKDYDTPRAVHDV